MDYALKVYLCFLKRLTEVEMNKITSDNLSEMTITGNQYLSDIVHFYDYYKSLKEPESYHKLVRLLEAFFLEMYPQERNRLAQFYVDLLNIDGDARLAHECVRIFMEATQRIASIGQSVYNLPLLYEHNSSLGRIGQLADEAASTRLQIQLGLIESKPVLCLPQNVSPSSNIMNKGFIPYLEDSFEIVSDSLTSQYFTSVTKLSPYSGFFYKLSNTQYGQVGKLFFDSCLSLRKNNINPHAFTLKDITINQGMKFLKSHGLNETDKFVVLHLREEGYFDGHQHIYRNVEPLDYIPAVEYLLEQGLKVIRIGHPKMKPILNRTGFIDLTQMDRPDEVDIFLCGRALFYLGSASGPYSVAHNFGVPCCVTSDVNYGGARPNNFMQYLKFWDTKNNSFLSFNDFDELNLKFIFSATVFKTKGYIPYFPSPQQNLRFVKEMLEYLEAGSISELNTLHNDAKEKHQLFGGLCSESLTLLD